MKKIITICVLLFATTNVFADEPNSVGEIFKAKGMEWLLGTWETTTENGEKVEAKFSLELDGYIIDVDATVGQIKNHGMIFLLPNKKTIIFHSLDNSGGMISGNCEIENHKLVMYLEIMKADRDIVRFTRYLSKTDADMMRSETFVLTDGKKPEQPTGVFEFKRKK